MLDVMTITAVFGGMMILLGFAALLSQKIYLDADTKEPVEIDVPVIGKMKTNYPALVFVLLGVAVLVYGIRQHQSEAPIQWQVDGQMESSEPFSWSKGTLVAFPQCDSKVDENGRFRITLALRGNLKFEDAVQRIDYSHLRGNIMIDTKKELAAYTRNPQDSHLVAVTDTTRSYRLRLDRLPPPLGVDPEGRQP